MTSHGFARFAELAQQCDVPPVVLLTSALPSIAIAILLAGVGLFRAAGAVARTYTGEEDAWPTMYVAHGLRGAALFCCWSLAVTIGAFSAPCLFLLDDRYFVGLFYWAGLFLALAFYAGWVLREIRARRAIPPSAVARG